MLNPYYKPYWDSSSELEHYGIKGMKWGTKKKTKLELRNTEFKDVKVGETIAWIGANFEWDDNSRTIKAPSIEARAKSKMNKVKRKLKEIAKVRVDSIGDKIIKFGQKVISSILPKFKNSK